MAIVCPTPKQPRIRTKNAIFPPIVLKMSRVFDPVIRQFWRREMGLLVELDPQGNTTRLLRQRQMACDMCEASAASA